VTEIEASTDLVIHARRIYDGVVADPRRYGPLAEDLVGRARRARDHEALVLALRAQAWAERARMSDVAAKRLLDQAARIARRYRLCRALADVLMTRAGVNIELGRIASARRDLDAAARLVRPDRAGELAFQRAVLHQNIGHLTAAAPIYRDLLGQPDTPLRIQALAANNLGLIEAQHGRYAEAQRRLTEAARAAAGVGPAVAALVAQSRAWTTVQSGRLAEALQLFDEAAKAYGAANLPLGEHYVEYVDALTDLRLIPEAMTVARRAVDEFGRGGIGLTRAEAQLQVARLAVLAGRPAEAEAAATAAATAFGGQGRAAWRARAVLVTAEARLQSGTATAADLRAVRRASRALEALGTSATAVQAGLVAGRIAARLGRTHEAVEALRHAGDLVRDAPVLLRLRGRVAAALAADLSGQDREVVAQCRRGLSDLARHRTALPSVELRTLASGHGAELGQLGLEVVVRDGAPARVLDWMERTRAAALLAVEPPDPGELADDLEALRAVHAELELLGHQPGQRVTPPAPLLAQQLAIENRIRRATWRRRSGAGRSGAATSVPRLRHLLDGRVLVEYGTLGAELVAVVLEPRRSRVVPLGPVSAVVEQLRALFFALRRLTQTRPPAALAAARLSADTRVATLTDRLIRPLGLAPDAEIVVVPVGALHGVPWSALRDAPVSLAPSATFWARTRIAARERADGGGVVLVAGPNLPGASTEVRRLRTLYPDATVVTPPSSTAATVAGLLDGAALAHLACHGWLRADNPMFSALILADGPLTVQELQTRGVAPHRLVLAACQSGADVSFAGDEVLGFVSALLARGCAGIVASTAEIPDVAAVDLAYALHRRLIGGDTLAHALYAARAGLDRAEPATYVNWCTFGAHGAA